MFDHPCPMLNINQILAPALFQPKCLLLYTNGVGDLQSALCVWPCLCVHEQEQE